MRFHFDPLNLTSNQWHKIPHHNVPALDKLYKNDWTEPFPQFPFDDLLFEEAPLAIGVQAYSHQE
jgi:hypothetical protein